MNSRKIFLDTDVIIDLLTERAPHFIGAAKLFLYIQNREILAFTSPVVFANLSYLLSKRFDKHRSVDLLRKLNTLVKILAVDQKIIEMALASDFTDSEDSIQYYTAVENHLEILITRNVQDYHLAKIQIFRPMEFLAQLDEKGNQTAENSEGK